MGQSLDRLIRALRDAPWLNAARARAYLVILSSLTVLGAIAYLALSRSGLDPSGKPIGTDFASFWTASQLALLGRPADAWNIQQHALVQADKFGAGAGYAAFFYPPPYLLVCLPLALLPYMLSLCAWLAATGYAYVRMARGWLAAAGAPDLGGLAILAFPAVAVNAGHGQNGFLTAALLGFGALLHERRPWIAGALFGALVIKPHLAVLVPLFLIFAGNWRAFLAAGLSAAALCLVSLAAFGVPAWQGFFEASATARAVLEQDLVGFAKMQSAFAAVRLLGGTPTLCWGAQILATLLAVAGMWAVRRSGPGLANGAALACATLLATPFLLDYDLTVLSVPLAWLFATARREGFLPWERLLLLAGFMLPLVSRTLASTLYLPLAPAVILALLLAVVRRARQGSARANA